MNFNPDPSKQVQDVYSVEKFIKSDIPSYFLTIRSSGNEFYKN